MIKTKIGDKYPVPNSNWLKKKIYHVGVGEGEYYIIGGCDCDRLSWPEVNNGCGPHLLNMKGEDQGVICFDFGKMEWVGEYIIDFIDSIKNGKLCTCPICGSLGDDLLFKFYCSDLSCQNYESP